MYILAIDTGSHESAFVLYNTETRCLADKNKLPNIECWKKFKSYFEQGKVQKVLIEQTSSNGSPVGMEVFMNCEFTGFFACLAKIYGISVELMFRKTVKMHLCGAIRKITDASVNLMLREKYGEDNTIKRPNKFYWNEEVEENKGVKWMTGDIWAALAVLTVYVEDPNVVQTELIKIDKEYIEFLKSKNN